MLQSNQRAEVLSLIKNWEGGGTDPPQRPSRATGGLGGGGSAFRLQHCYNLRPLG
jgi:hypothetical protein